MNRKVGKKIGSLILSVILLVTISIPVFAVEDETIEPHIDFVAGMKIIVNPTITIDYSGSGIGFGHACLVFINRSHNTITVGNMSVYAGDAVTIGTFGNRSSHKGIWYNIEACKGMGSSYYGLTTAVTATELLNINNVINSNDSWSVSNNCASFAVKVWNAGNSGRPVSGNNPIELAGSITSYSDYNKNPEIPLRFQGDIARHTPNGVVFDPSGYYDI
jgi:hypothetical protein|nr:hypothetical protein [uncultured Blautia sp.]